MALGARVCYGGRCARAGGGVVHLWADRLEGGGEVVEGPCKCGACVSDGDGDVFHTPLVFLEGRDEWVVLLGLFYLICIASEFSGAQ